jgi:hypothetical protein
MSGPWPFIPGVPAAGHIERGGFWHPGAIESCRKGRCGYDKEQAEAAERARVERHQEQRRRQREVAARLRQQEQEKEREREGG